jgi:hypothetical protein
MLKLWRLALFGFWMGTGARLVRRNLALANVSQDDGVRDSELAMAERVATIAADPGFASALANASEILSLWIATGTLDPPVVSIWLQEPAVEAAVAAAGVPNPLLGLAVSFFYAFFSAALGDGSEHAGAYGQVYEKIMDETRLSLGQAEMRAPLLELEDDLRLLLSLLLTMSSTANAEPEIQLDKIAEVWKQTDLLAGKIRTSSHADDASWALKMLPVLHQVELLDVNLLFQKERMRLRGTTTHDVRIQVKHQLTDGENSYDQFWSKIMAPAKRAAQVLVTEALGWDLGSDSFDNTTEWNYECRIHQIMETQMYGTMDAVHLMGCGQDNLFAVTCSTDCNRWLQSQVEQCYQSCLEECAESYAPQHLCTARDAELFCSEHIFPALEIFQLRHESFCSGPPLARYHFAREGTAE